MRSSDRILTRRAFPHLALKIGRMLAGQSRNAKRSDGTATRTVTARATTGELGGGSRKIATGTPRRGRETPKTLDVARHGLDGRRTTQVFVVGKMLHAQILSHSAAKILELSLHDGGRLAADRRNTAIGNAATIFAVARCAVSIPARTVVRGGAIRQKR